MGHLNKIDQLYRKRLEGLEDSNFEKENLLDVMIPYADLMTLLLVFFVFFFIISNVSSSTSKKEEDQYTVQDTISGANEKVITIPSEILFESGKADLKWEALRALADVAEQIKEKIGDEDGWQIRVEGHTDNVPIHNKKYSSNWDLSTARALSVVKFFMVHHYFKPDQLQAMGYGEFRPVAPNDTPENRRKNRRVEIRLSRVSKYNAKKSEETK
jgi:flagellar motor protein MotB